MSHFDGRVLVSCHAWHSCRVRRSADALPVSHHCCALVPWGCTAHECEYTLQTTRLCELPHVELTMRWHCRWEGPEPDADVAVKRINCAWVDAVMLDHVDKEVFMLKLAQSWRHCVGSTGCFSAPWSGKRGVRRGTSFYLAMECAQLARRQRCSALGSACTLSRI